MAWAGATLLLLIALAVSWHIHPEAPGLVIVFVVLGPLFIKALGVLFDSRTHPVGRTIGLLLAVAFGMGLLWGVSLVL